MGRFRNWSSLYMLESSVPIHFEKMKPTARPLRSV